MQKFWRCIFIAAVITAIALPANTYAGKLVIANVNVAMKSLGQGEFALHIQFPLSDLPTKTPIDNLIIDYAELSFEVHVNSIAERKQVEGKLLEILAAAVDGKALTNYGYNLNPALGYIWRKALGAEQAKLEITELVEHWVKGKVANNGLLIISHRRMMDKALRQGTVELPNNFKLPAVTIFFTESE
jgi:hypothetical protein